LALMADGEDGRGVKHGSKAAENLSLSEGTGVDAGEDTTGVRPAVRPINKDVPAWQICCTIEAYAQAFLRGGSDI
jgi:hypothetical protein